MTIDRVESRIMIGVSSFVFNANPIPHFLNSFPKDGEVQWPGIPKDINNNSLWMKMTINSLVIRQCRVRHWNCPCEFDPTPTFAVLSRFIHRFDLRRLTYNWNMITILAVLIYFLFCNIIASIGCFVSCYGHWSSIWFGKVQVSARKFRF